MSEYDQLEDTARIVRQIKIWMNAASVEQRVKYMEATHGDPASRDMLVAAKTLTDQEARFLVDAYYIVQDGRKRAVSQERELAEVGEPNDIIKWYRLHSEHFEETIKKALDYYTAAHKMGDWMRDVFGIGPVLSAGLLAHIDIGKAPTVGHIWAFAGIAGDGRKPWEKGQKRPFNAALKTLCWKIGDSFVKFSTNPDCAYGHLYRQRKALEVQRNDQGQFAAQAATALANKRYSKDTEAYKAYSTGHLPAAHLDMRARRWAVKQFLADLHAAWYFIEFGIEPPLPYPIAILGHAHLRKA